MTRTPRQLTKIYAEMMRFAESQLHDGGIDIDQVYYLLLAVNQINKVTKHELHNMDCIGI